MNKRRIEFAVDERGVVRSPDLHDATVSALNLESPGGRRVLTLSFRTTSGLELDVTVRGVERLRIDDLLEANIIFDARIQTLRQYGSQIVVDLFGSDSDRAQSTFAQMLAQEGSEHLSVLSISPAYGFTLVAVFREIEVLMTLAPAP